jgi:hypothetical protein
VLTLYDTLRELEGEFLVKYINSIDEDPEESNVQDSEAFETDPALATSYALPSNGSPVATNHKRQKLIEELEEPISIEEPAGWSMSLTPQGLSIQAVTRNLNEFNEFAKTLSRQLIRDFGSSYLPKQWDPDAEGYFEDTDEEELDEDEYLVTVPVFSTCSLLVDKSPTVNSALKPLLHDSDTLVTLVRSHFPHMRKHLQARYKWLEQNTNVSMPHHLVILIQQLKMYIPGYAPQYSLEHSPDSLAKIALLTAYVVSVTLLPPIPNTLCPPLPTSLWRDCAEYATMLLMDLILIEGDEMAPYPTILCAVLLAWVDAELCSEFKADAMIHIALRVLCSCDWQSEEPAWQILIAALVYLDVYSATFRFHRPQLHGQGLTELWQAAMRMREPSRWQNSFREAGIVFEARLMSLLNKVVSLFYQVDKEPQELSVRKIDVDEVLTLVRDVELWEQELPEWAKWHYELSEQEFARQGLKMHMHMIHNMVKILLFRPFCTDMNKESEQTFTKTTFLDMSTAAADRLTICLCHIHDAGFWTRATSSLVRDVSKRVLKMFGKDEDIVRQLDIIQRRLEKAEQIIIKRMISSC